MKISELPHRDPVWAYIELNDGSLVAMPKNAIKELQDENERMKAENAKLRNDRLLYRYLLWKHIDKGFLHLKHLDKGWCYFVSQCDRIERRCKEAYRKAKERTDGGKMKCLNYYLLMQRIIKEGK